MSKITYSTIYTDGLSDAQVNDDFDAALVQLRTAGPIQCAHVVDGETVEVGAPFVREDPTRPGRVVAQAFEGDRNLVDRAVAGAHRACATWERTGFEARLEVMRELATRIEAQRIALAALMSHETGKTRADALAEVDECGAILDLYVEQMTVNNGYVFPLAAPSAGAVARVVYRPYGVFGTILPFNFPLALPLGMACGALVTGNAVVFKPSALTPATGQAFFDLFAGILPAGVLQLVHGGSATGRALAESSVDGMGFTGSATVGLELAQLLTQAPYIRPLIAEMGGKNPSIVTGRVGDVAVAARATARAAFGLAGQKCVSCSRAIVTADVYDAFLEALVDYTSTLKVGDPIDRTVFTGPLVKRDSQERFESVVAEARRDGAVLVGGGSSSAGYFAEPTVAVGLPKGHRLTREELFVPLLTVTRVKDFDAALREANAVTYGLSAGIYSEDAEEQARFLDEIEAGITLVNSPSGATTGIWPGNQTMAGWKSTGSTGKGGFGPFYLPQYMREQSRTIYPPLA
jgi:1-pyrroline-5-carboxylate dehydrogenase